MKELTREQRAKFDRLSREVDGMAGASQENRRKRENIRNELIEKKNYRARISAASPTATMIETIDREITELRAELQTLQDEYRQIDLERAAAVELLNRTRQWLLENGYFLPGEPRTYAGAGPLPAYTTER